MKLSNAAAALALFFLAKNCWSQGTLIAGHFGATDPTSEGFILFRSGSPSLAPVMDDLGLSAWHIGLDTNRDIGQYTQLLAAHEQAELEAGWTMSLTLSIGQPYGTPTVGIFVQLLTGVEAFPLLTFGAQSDGDPILRLGNSEYAMEGSGPGYHNYQLRYDADLGLASLWVDGSRLATGIAGSPNPTAAQFSWGGGQHPPGSAYANWNEVSLWAIPEPSSFALLGLGGLWLTSRRLKRR